MRVGESTQTHSGRNSENPDMKRGAKKRGRNSYCVTEVQRGQGKKRESRQRDRHEEKEERLCIPCS